MKLISGMTAVGLASLTALTAACGTTTASSRTASTVPPVWRAMTTAEWLAVDSKIVTTGPTEAWALGGRGPTEEVQWPSANRWDGRTWRNVPLPPGRNGTIRAAAASAPDNVWAATGGAGDSHVLRWDGRAWSGVRRLPIGVTDLVVIDPGNVWVFGTSRGPEDGIAWHYTDQGWSRERLPFAVRRASARTGQDIWAVGWREGGREAVGHYDGTRWRQVGVPAPPRAAVPSPKPKPKPSGGPATRPPRAEPPAEPPPIAVPPFDPRNPKPSRAWGGANGRASFSAVTATRDGVWITADSHISAGPLGPSWLLAFDGRTWRYEKVAHQWAEGVPPVPDGRGGLWFLGTPHGETAAVLVHRSAKGQWTSGAVKASGVLEADLRTLARVPGSARLFSSGQIYGPGNVETGAILSYG